MTNIDVAVGTKHPKEAMAYVDGILGLLFQLGMVYEFPYGPSNKMLMPILAAYPDISKKFPASPADLERLRRIDWSIFNKMLPQAIDLWNRKITSR